jgi:hypothetical protein
MLLKNSSGEITKIRGTETDDYILFNKVDFIKDKDRELLDHFTFATGPLAKNGENETGSSMSDPNYNEISTNLNQIKLYPNPVKAGQEFTIVFPPMENLSISIYDGGGRLFKMEKIPHNSKSYRGSLSVQSSYLVSLVLGDKVIKTFKLIVD